MFNIFISCRKYGPICQMIDIVKVSTVQSGKSNLTLCLSKK